MDTGGIIICSIRAISFVVTMVLLFLSIKHRDD